MYHVILQGFISQLMLDDKLCIYQSSHAGMSLILAFVGVQYYQNWRSTIFRTGKIQKHAIREVGLKIVRVKKSDKLGDLESHTY